MRILLQLMKRYCDDISFSFPFDPLHRRSRDQEGNQCPPRLIATVIRRYSASAFTFMSHPCHGRPRLLLSLRTLSGLTSNKANGIASACARTVGAWRSRPTEAATPPTRLSHFPDLLLDIRLAHADLRPGFRTYNVEHFEHPLEFELGRP